MKLKLFFAILLIAGSTGARAQYPIADSMLWAERDYFYKKYRSVRDTMKINTWLNLKRVSDNLEQVVKRDQQVIFGMQQRIAQDSAIIASNQDVAKQYQELSANYDRLVENSGNKAAMLVYLKTAAGVLIFLFFILIYYIVGMSKKIQKSKDERDHYEALVAERQKQIDVMDSELRKMKQREMEFRDELERGMQLHQERLNALQSKCFQLEKENKELKTTLPDGFSSSLTISSETHIMQELPEDPESLKQLTKSLYDERSSLINLAGKLRIQVEEQNRRNHDIIEKISLLARGLAD